MEVLHRLPAASHPDLLVGAGTLDDAGVFRLGPELALVQTLDFFPPVVDDPRWYGRIAAANALSDVYAMGGRPITAMNIVGFPQELGTDVLAEILLGGAEKIEEAGAVLVGGHSVRDREVKYGLSVTGVVHPERVLGNAGALPGDVLVLTKRLGMGAVTTALKKGEVDEALAEEACAQMARLNRAASEAALEVGVRAATDVTGFGLLGHARQVAEASGVTLLFRASALPVFPGAERLAERGFTSGGAVRTRTFLGDAARVEAGVPEAIELLAFDAETSGGLLLSVEAARADALLGALEDRGESGWIVGEVTELQGPVRVRLVP